MDLSIIIPCFNEVENVTKLEAELVPVLVELSTTYRIELIFIDDGSVDGTLEALRTTFVNNRSLGNVSQLFERHPTNLGLGAALRTGFSVSTGQVVITTDSDGTYKFENIPALLDNLTEDIDIVTASPYHPDGDVAGVPGYRLFLSQGSSLIYRVLVDRRIHTYTCLFRAYRRPVIETIIINSNGFLSGTELIVKAMLVGFQVKEFPATLYARAYGASKAKIIRTIWAHLRFQVQILLHHLRLKSLVHRNTKGGQIWPRSKTSSPEGDIQ
jgi:dolichol-phosphate mannosyltransferase